MTPPATLSDMAEIEQTPRYAIGQWQKKEIDGTTLMRQMVAWKRWSVAISESAAVEMLAANEASRLMYGRDPNGMVFNCKGPVRPIAFAAGISELILESVPRPEQVAGCV